jgi:hypothetical protein
MMMMMSSMNNYFITWAKSGNQNFLVQQVVKMEARNFKSFFSKSTVNSNLSAFELKKKKKKARKNGHTSANSAP